MTPRISVIIPAYNAAGTIRACIEALQRQTVSASEYEIIVVDDGSEDQTREIVEEYGVCLIAQPNGGPAAARNLGVQHAQGELLLFTDADCEPAPDWIEQMIVPFTCPEVVGAKGVYKTRQRELVARFVQLEYEEKYDRMQKGKYIDFIDTYSAAYRRLVFRAYGGFDPSFPQASGEDVEFSYRLARKGCKLMFVPQAGVYHRHPDSLVKYFRRKFHVGYWRVLMYRRHPQKMLVDSHTPQSLKLQVGLAPGLVGASVLSIVWSRMRWIVGAGMSIFALSTVSFVKHASRKDSAVAAVAPLLLFIRGLASGLGLLAGVVHQIGLRETTGQEG